MCNESKLRLKSTHNPGFFVRKQTEKLLKAIKQHYQQKAEESQVK